MRVLLDECLPRQLRLELIGHEVRTVPEIGWAGKKNGELLALAEGDFDVLLTIDQNLSTQQNLAGRGIAIVTLKARSNRFADLQPLVPRVLDAISKIRAGQVERVG